MTVDIFFPLGHKEGLVSACGHFQNSIQFLSVFVELVGVLKTEIYRGLPSTLDLICKN